MSTKAIDALWNSHGAQGFFPGPGIFDLVCLSGGHVIRRWTTMAYNFARSLIEIRGRLHIYGKLGPGIQECKYSITLHLRRIADSNQCPNIFRMISGPFSQKIKNTPISEPPAITPDATG